MDWEHIRGKWDQLKGRARETWGHLTDDDLEVIKGKRDLLVGKLREVYGLAKGEAERQVAEFGRIAGATVTGAAGKAKTSGKGALSAAKKAGGAALGGALDAASAGIDRVRGFITPEGKPEKTASQASESRPRRMKTKGSGAERGKKRPQPRGKSRG